MVLWTMQAKKAGQFTRRTRAATLCRPSQPPFLFQLSRRLFPRLALTKEERQHLLKYDFLHQNYEDDNSSAASVVADRSVTRQVERDSPPDTSWERQHRDSAEELPPIVASACRSCSTSCRHIEVHNILSASLPVIILLESALSAIYKSLNCLLISPQFYRLIQYRLEQYMFL